MSLLQTLYCEEKHQWEDEAESYCSVDNDDIDPQELLDLDLIWEDEELAFLMSKESQHHRHHHLPPPPAKNNHQDRREAVEWILGAVSHHSFTALTAVLAVNYLDRFLESKNTEKRQPWMTHLAAVSCLSLAAKVEETHVPLLLDLQVEESKYVFEAKTIQRMEVLVLSTLQWRMNPVTPLSFLDYIIRRLGLKNHLSWEFLKRCESLLLCLLPDVRFRDYLPSVIATATMVHVINSLKPCIGIEYQSQLLGILGISKDKVDDCSKQIQEMICGKNPGRHFYKRKFGSVPGSPDGVMDLSFSSSDSWVVAAPANPSSVSSSPEPLLKKSRTGAA